jgi:L-fuculose-phosphate aldolase
MASDRQYREEIVRFGRMLHERGFVAATDGNLSVRLDHRRILATPTCMSKGMMRASDLLIYRSRPDVRGVVHAHPPTATGFAAAGLALNQPLVCEVVIGLGCIPLARYGTPGTPELTNALEPLVPQYDAILMANHGVVAYGEDLSRAYMKMEIVEHFARIALVAHLLGHQQLLSAQEIEKLIVARSRYQGAKSAAPMPLQIPNGTGADGKDHPSTGFQSASHTLRSSSGRSQSQQ